MSEKHPPFFVGYLGIPRDLRRFLLKVSLLLVASFAAGGLLAGIAQDDPGKAGFRFDYGPQTISGVVEAKPYPLLHVTSGTERIKAGSTLMLSGQGKSGAMQNVIEQEGRIVEATGILLNRGDLRMLQLRGGKRGIRPADQDGLIPESISLGKWRLQGEICDGKCLAGAMQPGRGIAHKACANLCLLGDIPPVFVSTQPIDGEEFLLVGGRDGGALPVQAYDFVGQFVEVEVDVERRGDILVMFVDAAAIKAVK